MAWSSSQKYLAEFLGTLALLTFGGGAAVFTAGNPDNARTVLVAAAVGLTVMAGAYIFGDISGGHFNPAVTLSMAASRRMPARDVLPYLVAQIVGGFTGILIVVGIAYGSTPGWKTGLLSSFGSQCYASSTAPLGCTYSMGSVFLIEMVLTFLFVLVIQMITRPENGAKNLAPLGIGLTLVVANLTAIPVDGASLNPVRSFSPAVASQIWQFSGVTPWALGESWLFWVAPIVGGLLAAAVEMWLRPQP
ncbi:MAG: aquaporin [Thermoplasmata archaeon]|nr:aquaporin [Thermoplasmata archaeon]